MFCAGARVSEIHPYYCTWLSSPNPPPAWYPTVLGYLAILLCLLLTDTWIARLVPLGTLLYVSFGEQVTTFLLHEHLGAELEGHGEMVSPMVAPIHTVMYEGTSSPTASPIGVSVFSISSTLGGVLCEF